MPTGNGGRARGHPLGERCWCRLSNSTAVTLTLAEALGTAIELHRQGRLTDAELFYAAVLEGDADNVDALHFLGVLRHQQGQPQLAVELVSRAIAVRPEYVDAHNNLGNIHQEAGNLEAAAVAYQTALGLHPDQLNALKNLGIVARKLGRLAESAELLQRARALAPQDPDLLHSLASTLRKLARYDEAAACLQTALAIRPTSERFMLLGATFHVANRIDQAAATYAAWLRAEPDNPIAKHMVAASQVGDGEVPARADDAYITRLFDGFADRFDEVLVERLDYRGPALVAAALARTLDAPRGDQSILDAGCGTGLLAPVLRPYARKLVGMDLQPRCWPRRPHVRCMTKPSTPNSRRSCAHHPAPSTSSRRPTL